jgi:putative ABC transport system permease protein
MLRELRVGLLIALRELRGSRTGLLIFVSCLALGVSCIAAVGTVNDAIVDAVRRDARVILGGDIELESPMQPLEAALLADLTPPEARVSQQVDVNSMAASGDHRTPVVIKAVDDAYPLYGAITLAPSLRLDQALAGNGAVAERALATRLGIEVGDRFRLGGQELELRAFIEREPDRVGGFVSIGPRLIISIATLEAARVLQPGAIVDFEYRLALPPGSDVAATARAMHELRPDAGWRIRTSADVQPQLARATDRLATYLTLAGLTALLIGGLGVGLASQTYLGGKIATISALKCLGATHGQIVSTYLIQILVMSAAGVIAGLLIGQALPLALLYLPNALLPIEIPYGFYPRPLLLAGTAGMAAALCFALWPLGLAREASPAALFRSAGEVPRSVPRWTFLLALAANVLVLGAVAAFGVPRLEIGLVYLAGVAGSAVLLAMAAHGMVRALGWVGERGPTHLRLAMRNLRQRSFGTISVTIALGSGVAVLTCVLLLQGNLRDEIARSVPARAPTTVFIDIQPDQVAPFRDLVEARPGVRLREMAPHLRGRIVRLGGVPVEQAVVADEVRWTLNRDRGITYRADQPPQSDLAAGSWWPPDYAGAPLISLDDGIAAGYGLGVGNTISINILGRVIEATIANLRRDVDFASGRLEFFFIMSPGLIERAPHTSVATIEASSEAEAELIRDVADALPNVTAISIGSVVAQLSEMLQRIGIAVQIVAGIAVASGLLVLGGAIGAARRRQKQQAVMLKVLGAARQDVLRILCCEYAILGVAAAALGTALGTLGAYLLTTQVFDLAWSFSPLPVLSLALGAVGLVVAVGGAATWRLLAVPSAQVLRTPA